MGRKVEVQMPPGHDAEVPDEGDPEKELLAGQAWEGADSFV